MGMKHFAWAALALVIGAVAMTPNTAQSAVIITFEETGGDVTMTLTGSLNVSALGTPSLTTVGNGVGPSIPNIAVGNVIDFYGSAGLTGPAFGPGGPAGASSASGDSFFFNVSLDAVGVPGGYVSGTALSSTLTFLGETFLSMGMTPGSYLYTFPGDTITVNVGPVSVPAPAGLPLMLMGLGAVALVRQRRKKTKHA